MNASVILLVLVSALLHAAWNLVCKSKKPSGAFFMIATLSSITAMTPLYLYFAPRLALISPTVWILLIGTGLSQAIYYVSLANAYRLQDISFVYPLARSLPVLLVPIVCWLIGYGEPLRPLAILGMSVIVVGCLVLPLTAIHASTLKHYWQPSVIFVLLAAVGTTGYTIIDSFALKQLHQAMPVQMEAALFYIALENLCIALFLIPYVFLSKVERANLRRFTKSEVRFPICSGLTCTFAYTLILIAMQHATNVSYVTALRQVSILLGVLMGVALLKEKYNTFKAVGVGLIFTGLVLTAFK
jgi:drug/metabolite transporter (DMT)-like permease